MNAAHSVTGDLIVRRLFSFLTVAALATMGALSGITLGQPSRAELLAFSTAQAQTVSDEEINNYARAVLEMEPHRQEAYDEIKQLVGTTNGLDMSCVNTRSLNNVPRNVRRDVRLILVDYCNQAGTIVRENNLTPDQFNQITAAHQNDPSLAARIQEAILELQQQQ